jgi:8-oxo-dGTP pyrophosphatase MutT (NUDIX family)
VTAGQLAILLAALLALAVLLGPYLLRVASRLDRLHVRTDAAWSGLDAALARRAVVTRAVVAAAAPDGGDALHEAADLAERADRADREAAENVLSRLLGELDRTPLPDGLAEELADAEHRVVLARRVHNDAVRDTRALRRRRVVRWLRLAGTAPYPEYFEIAEPVLDDGPDPERRRAARIVLADKTDRVLLFRGVDPARPAEPFWFTPGGGVEAGEDLRGTAVRELREETGLRIDGSQLVGPAWVRRQSIPWNGETWHVEEWFFLLRLDPADADAIDTGGFTQLERDTIDAHRWWTPEDLAGTSDTVYPAEFAAQLPTLLTTTWDGRTRPIT